MTALYNYVDVETTGFNGVVVTIQHAYGDATPKLHHAWKERVGDTLRLIEFFMEKGYVAFNMVFDHFHLQKFYCMLWLLREEFGEDARPIDHVEWLYKNEPQARFVDRCLKPSKCIDLMLHAARGPFQAFAKRKEIRITRVPAMIAPTVSRDLNERNKIEPIYQAEFSVVEHKEKGKKSEQWNDIKLRFKGNLKLKTLAVLLLSEEVQSFDDVRPDVMSTEEGWAPWASAWKGRTIETVRKGSGPKKGDPHITWDEVIHDHVEFWETDADAIRYGLDDVVYLQKLHKLPEFSDADPTCFDHKLAAHVGAVRWRGFPIDIPKFKALRQKYLAVVNSVPSQGARGKALMDWLRENLSPERYSIIEEKGTSKEVVEKLLRAWGECEPLERLAQARKAKKRIEMIDKLLHAGRGHPDYRINGTLSNRMGGAGGVNWQGFPRQEEFRHCFIIADEGFDCQYGDFDSHEIAIAETVYDDPALTADLATGKKFHGLLGESLFQMDYEDVIADKAIYDKAKRGGFGLNYGGNWMTLLMRGIVDTEEQAQRGENDFLKRYPGILKQRTEGEQSYKSMFQDKHKRVHYREPKDYVESPLGYRRWFTHENSIVKFFFDLASHPPQSWKAFDHLQVLRRQNKGLQSPCGAVMSALFLAAFNLQNKNARAAINHKMQSVGGETCKDLQAQLADLQPDGVHPWMIATFNVHDEITAAVRDDIKDEPTKVVNRVIEYYRPTIKYIGMQWETGLRFWKDEGKG